MVNIIIIYLFMKSLITLKDKTAPDQAPAKHLFSYNRKLFKFENLQNQDQQIFVYTVYTISNFK